MDISNWIVAFAVAANAGSSVLAWVAKLRWSEEFKQAKEAEITALKAQLEMV